MKPANTVKNRIFFADFTKRYDGVKVGFSYHSLRRSIGRYYPFMSNELLADNICALLQQVPDLEDRLMDLLPNESFVVTRESDGLTIFASYDYETNSADADVLVFVHTIYVANEGQRVYVDDSDKLLLKVCQNGTIEENPPELRRKNA